ncbi:acyl-CoA/acyl-ACP dehydrogenase [Streptomyces sp. J2-1]|uniref:acyl-CoA dehydrogenase family protein n=1 Tax=Streptomyces corallincola TaxID=2851888 RepID=UPI001C380E2F|nr:acyl-CoA dehydrogenase family protein [Streptomyces corallincola]MBV2352784.1 acyl-CoA/acyl-ACP dehydrogenase [Streptomyces corallincola]
MTDLLYSEEEEALRAAVRDLLSDHCAATDVLARVERPTPYEPALWKSLAEDMGLAGLLIPEDLGGQGASHREAAVVLEELGRAVAPVPYLTSAVVATEAVLACGDPDLLGRLASGRELAALAVGLHVAPGTGPGNVVVRDGVLHGEVSGVADAVGVGVLLVPGDDGVLYEVEASGAGVSVVPQTSLDPTRPLGRVVLDGAAGRALGSAGPAVERALLAGAGLLASEQLGLSEWALTETVRYLKERRQFNRPVGGFQALKHRLAHLWLQVVNLRAAARSAAGALASGEDLGVSVSVAQAYAGGVAVHVTEEALQLHGGLGMTWEHPVHLYVKRAKSDSLSYGTAGTHRALLSALVDLPAP